MKPRTVRYLVAILAVSVLARVGVALYLGDEVDAPPLLTDQLSYHTLGVRLVGGHGFSFDKNWYPFTPANTPTAHWSFLYSLFVAAVYALFGPHPLAVRVIQAILGGLLLPWMVYRLARAVLPEAMPREPDGGDAVALVAALIAALYAYLVLYAATLMTETFYIAALLWSLERSLKLANRLRHGSEGGRFWPLAASLGLSLGSAVLFRQSLLPWIPVLILYLLWVGWRGARVLSAVASSAIGVAVLAVMILPWTLRNYRVYGQFLLLNSNAGYAMYSAQHPMHGTSFREFEAAPIPDDWWGWTEPKLDQALMRQGIQFILDDPGRYALLSLSRVRAFFEFWPTRDTTLLNNVGRTGSFGLFLPLMVYGLILAVRSPKWARSRSLLFLFIAFYAVMHVMTWAMARYRLPVDAVFLAFAALALLDLLRRARALCRSPRTRTCRPGAREP